MKKSAAAVTARTEANVLGNRRSIDRWVKPASESRCNSAMAFPGSVDFIIAPAAIVFMPGMLPETTSHSPGIRLLMACKKRRRRRRSHGDRPDLRAGVIRTLADRPRGIHLRPFHTSFAGFPLAHALATCGQGVD